MRADLRMGCACDLCAVCAVSVQQLDRACVQLQAIVTEHERAVKSLEESFQRAVTKQHVELLLQGKVTQQELHASFAGLSQQLESLLANKADHATVEALLASKASLNAVDNVRADLLSLKEALRNGEGLEELNAKHVSNPLQDYQKQMGELMRQLRDEQEKMRAEEEAQAEARNRRRQQSGSSTATAGKGGQNGRDGRDGRDGAHRDGGGNEPIRSGRFNSDGTEILLNADGSVWHSDEHARDDAAGGTSSDPSAGGRSGAMSATERSAWDEQERRELRDRIARMEMAIQLANASPAGANANGGQSDQEAENELARLERAMDTKYERTHKVVEELRAKCAQAERDVERLTRAVETKNRSSSAMGGSVGSGGGAGGGGMGGSGSTMVSSLVPSQELTYFMQELSTVQRGLSQSTGVHGKSVYETVLLPQARESASVLVEVRNQLREQNRARARLLDTLADAKSTVSHDVSELFAQVQMLRRRLKAHTNEFGREWIGLLREQRHAWTELEAWKADVADQVQHMLDAAEHSASTLAQLQEPLHEQLREVQHAEIDLRDAQVRARFAAEYARMRQRYEEVRAQEEDTLAQHQHQQHQLQLQHPLTREEKIDDGSGVDAWSDAADASPLHLRPLTSPTAANRVSWGQFPSPWQPSSTAASPSPPLPPPSHSPRGRTIRIPTARALSASMLRPGTAAATAAAASHAVPSAPASARAATSHASSPASYMPAADSSFRALSPSAGPRWATPPREQAQAQAQARPATCSSSGRTFTPSSRPGSRDGLTPRGSGPGAARNRGSGSRADSGDVGQTLEMLHERLSMLHLSAFGGANTTLPSPANASRTNHMSRLGTPLYSPADSSNSNGAVAGAPQSFHSLPNEVPSTPRTQPHSSLIPTSPFPRGGSSKSSRIVTRVSDVALQQRFRDRADG